MEECIERIAYRKEREEKNCHQVDHLGTRFCSLGYFYCELIFKADSTRAPTPDHQNIRNQIIQMNNEQIFEIARAVKFDLKFVELDDDYFTNTSDDVDELLAQNADLHNWKHAHSGLKFVSAKISSHTRSRLTGAPFPERVFNRITIKVHFPRTIDALA